MTLSRFLPKLVGRAISAVTGSAVSVALGINSGVGLRVKVPIITSRLVSFVVRSVSDHVPVVVGVGIPTKVLRPTVVLKAARPVASLLTRRTRLSERSQDKDVNVALSGHSTLAETALQVPTFHGWGLKQTATAPASRSHSAQATDMASIRDIVEIFKSNYRLPSFHASSVRLVADLVQLERS